VIDNEAVTSVKAGWVLIPSNLYSRLDFLCGAIGRAENGRSVLLSADIHKKECLKIDCGHQWGSSAVTAKAFLKTKKSRQYKP
jgi:hypothetical protein